MNKIRIYELAKKLDVANKVILTEIAKLGIEGKTHASSIEGELAGKIEAIVLKKTAHPAKEEPSLKKKEKETCSAPCWSSSKKT
jgi:translation initiation factor IF-2